MGFNVGDQFASYEEFQQALVGYEKSTFVQLWKRDSRTLAAAQGRCPNRKFNSAIKFYELTYSCVHGGKKHHSKSTAGLRPNQKTFKIECPFTLKLRANPEGTHLLVTKFDNIHNHNVLECLYNVMPAQRRLNKEDKEKAKEMLKVNADTEKTSAASFVDKFRKGFNHERHSQHRYLSEIKVKVFLLEDSTQRHRQLFEQSTRRYC
ncbi:hypothetical protein V1264_020144 [Littorina saxatilis]|uniref:ZSWIM3 N-terminal domain-containing protein n=1 Tax=Littorina saxatilis TaxID=31220 RepID=A0AAN9BAY7_9CAEN